MLGEPTGVATGLPPGLAAGVSTGEAVGTAVGAVVGAPLGAGPEGTGTTRTVPTSEPLEPPTTTTWWLPGELTIDCGFASSFSVVCVFFSGAQPDVRSGQTWSTSARVSW